MKRSPDGKPENGPAHGTVSTHQNSRANRPPHWHHATRGCAAHPKASDNAVSDSRTAAAPSSTRVASAATSWKRPAVCHESMEIEMENGEHWRTHGGSRAF